NGRIRAHCRIGQPASKSACATTPVAPCIQGLALLDASNDIEPVQLQTPGRMSTPAPCQANPSRDALFRIIVPQWTSSFSNKIYRVIGNKWRHAFSYPPIPCDPWLILDLAFRISIFEFGPCETARLLRSTKRSKASFHSLA